MRPYTLAVLHLTVKIDNMMVTTYLHVVCKARLRKYVNTYMTSDWALVEPRPSLCFKKMVLGSKKFLQWFYTYLNIWATY